MNDNPQTPQIVTGSNAGNDEYSTPLPQGATVGGAQGQVNLPNEGQVTTNDDYSAPIPQGANVGQTGMQKLTSDLEKPLAPGTDTSTMEGANADINTKMGQVFSGGIKSAAGGAGNILHFLSEPNKLEEENFKISYKLTHPDAPQDDADQAWQAKVQQFKDSSYHQIVSGAADWLKSSGDPKGALQNLGALGEQLLEWIGTDGLTKLAAAPTIAGGAAANVTAHAKQVSNVANTLANNKPLAGVVAVGLRTLKDAAMAGTQTLVHTGDVGEAEKSALLGGAISGPLNAVGEIGSTLASKGGEAADIAGNLSKKAQFGPSSATVEDKLAQTAKNAYQAELDTANQQIAQAEKDLQTSGQAISGAGTGAPSNEGITAATQKAVKQAHTDLQTNYLNGISQLKNELSGQNLAYEGSPLQKAAKDLAGSAESESHDLDSAFNVVRPGGPKSNRIIDTLANFGKEAEGEAGAAEGVVKEPVTMNLDNLMQWRKKVGEAFRNTGWASSEDRADRDVYKKLLQGIDDSIQKLADQSGNPAATDILGATNKAYKEGISRFDNADVQKLLEGDSKDVAQRMMRGETAPADIKNLKETIGNDAFNKLAEDSLSRRIAETTDPKTGEFNLQKFINNWTKDRQTTDAMFGGTNNAPMIEKAITAAQAANKTLPLAKEDLAQTNKAVAELIGNGDISSLLKDPKRVQDLNSVVGPNGMADLGKAVLANQLREAATVTTKGGTKISSVDPDKLFKFIDSMKDNPEVRNTLFKATPQSTAAYNKLLQDLAKVQSVKHAVAMGVFAPAGAAVAGTAAGLVGHGAVPAIVGAMAAMGGEFIPKARNFLEYLANHPNTWRTIKSIDNAVSSPVGKMAGTAIKATPIIGVDNRKSIFQGAQSSLSK